jgi:hypothetical protein
MRYERTNTYDTERVLRDITRDRLLFNVIYNNSGLDVRYQGIYDQNNNKLAQLKIRELTHNGIFSYSSTFFKNRVSVYASYNISRTDTKTVASRSGEVRSQQFPFSGLSSLDDSPAMGTLDPNPALIDGAVSIGSGVNIGLPPVAGDTRPRNIGVDFFSDTEVNTLLIWIDRELPDDIAASFTWDIYTSADNIMWNLESTVAPAPFGPFENRFEIDFSTVNSRYIKVVTRPLAATVVGSAAFPNILVTEIQAFIRKPVEDVEGRTSRTSQIANLDIRTRLLDTPMVFHEFSYYLSKREPFSQTRWTLSNGLSITHRFNRVFSSSARVAREDVAEEDERGVNYTYNATVRAEPLDTLSHTLLLSRRNESIGDETIDRDSMFLQNTASLYKGIDVFLHGGVSSTRQGTGQKQESLIVTSGANFIPHETLTVNVNYTDTTTNRSGGGGPEGLLVNRRGDVGVSFRPFQTVYLFGSLSHVTQEDRIYMLNNYAVNWSPFPYGALQFNFAYNEEFRTENNEKLRNISPSLRWNITNRIFLNVSYQMIRSQSNQQTSDIRVFNANVKMRY